jgi:hypothetical protein
MGYAVSSQVNHNRRNPVPSSIIVHKSTDQSEKENTIGIHGGQPPGFGPDSTGKEPYENSELRREKGETRRCTRKRLRLSKPE